MFSVRSDRRDFLRNVGRGMLAAGLGGAAAGDLGIATAWAEEEPTRLTFGAHERLVCLMQETPPERLLPQLVARLQSGTELGELVAAAALANARAFGGEDYIGFHTFMALRPSLLMARELPAERRALPVLKVLYRNAARLQDAGRAVDDVLHPFAASPFDAALDRPLRDAIYAEDAPAAEHVLAAAAGVSAETAWNTLLPAVQEAPEVHRIVLAHRAWDMLDLVGIEHAQTMLRQSVRFCVRGEGPRARHFSHVPALLTRVLEQHKLLSFGADAERSEKASLGVREADDAWIEEMVHTLFTSSPEVAAGAVAAALAEGFSPAALSEAVCLTANQLVLRDAGRPAEQAQPGKPVGSVHGDSIGVHASDAANAWRHIARVSNPVNAAASLVLSGWHVAQDRVARGGRFDEWRARPWPEHVEGLTVDDPARLLSELEAAIRGHDQDRAAACAHRYLELGHREGPVFDLLLRCATSEDGELHAEKYYWTVRDEFRRTRPRFRNRQLVALARVTASTYGTPAPGYEEACELLGCET